MAFVFVKSHFFVFLFLHKCTSFPLLKRNRGALLRRKRRRERDLNPYGLSATSSPAAFFGMRSNFRQPFFKRLCQKNLGKTAGFFASLPFWPLAKRAHFRFCENRVFFKKASQGWRINQVLPSLQLFLKRKVDKRIFRKPFFKRLCKGFAPRGRNPSGFFVSSQSEALWDQQNLRFCLVTQNPIRIFRQPFFKRLLRTRRDLNPQSSPRVNIFLANLFELQKF